MKNHHILGILFSDRPVYSIPLKFDLHTPDQCGTALFSAIFSATAPRRAEMVCKRNLRKSFTFHRFGVRSNLEGLETLNARCGDPSQLLLGWSSPSKLLLIPFLRSRHVSTRGNLAIWWGFDLVSVIPGFWACVQSGLWWSTQFRLLCYPPTVAIASREMISAIWCNCMQFLIS